MFLCGKFNGLDRLDIGRDGCLYAIVSGKKIFRKPGRIIRCNAQYIL
jgi:hypothetical protein